MEERFLLQWSGLNSYYCEGKAVTRKSRKPIAYHWLPQEWWTLLSQSFCRQAEIVKLSLLLASSAFLSVTTAFLQVITCSTGAWVMFPVEKEASRAGFVMLSPASKSIAKWAQAMHPAASGVSAPLLCCIDSLNCLLFISYPQLPKVPTSSLRWLRWRTELHSAADSHLVFPSISSALKCVRKREVSFSSFKSSIWGPSIPHSKGCMCEAITTRLVWRKIRPSVSKLANRKLIVLSAQLQWQAHCGLSLPTRGRALVCWSSMPVPPPGWDRGQSWAGVMVTKVYFILSRRWLVHVRIRSGFVHYVQLEFSLSPPQCMLIWKYHMSSFSSNLSIQPFPICPSVCFRHGSQPNWFWGISISPMDFQAGTENDSPFIHTSNRPVWVKVPGVQSRSKDHEVKPYHLPERLLQSACI